MIYICFIVLLVALLPVLMFLKNRTLFVRAPKSLASTNELNQVKSSVSVLIPARNEASSIRQSLNSILQSDLTLMNLVDCMEVLVLDDQSEDETASIVESIVSQDSRVRLIRSQSLPDGWNGKQYACWQLANHASSAYLLFLDADVRLTPDAIARCMAEQRLRKAPLVSGFPKQETLTLAEQLLIPMMHYVLLCYLPIERMRATLGVGLAAGCGQLFLAEREAYFQAGGHQSLKGSRHDGIQLPRAFRRVGFKTDIFDASDIATCRMYTNTRQVCNGLLKNATEGVGNPRLILIFTFLLVVGSVVPFLIFSGLISSGYIDTLSVVLMLIASAISFVPRLVACGQFHQSIVGACLHPVAIVIFVGLQWIALIRMMLGLTTQWRGRS
jgi:glycosyltransferase involved in cell wall biosynthesis